MKYIIKKQLKTNVTKVIYNNNMSCFVYFKNNPNSFPYNKLLVEEVLEEEIYDSKNYLVKINDKYIDDITSIVKYKTNRNTWFYLKISSESKLYLANSITLIENALIKSKELFNYINDIIKYMTDNPGSYNEKITKSLKNKLAEIKQVFPDIVLYNYLLGETIEKYKSINYIFPFHSNLSQINAVKSAFTNQISVIDGPPGCGKTQTILNIIANAVYNDKTIAVVSSNNSAVNNIKEKLKKNNFDFICASLGSLSNNEKFFEEQPEYPEYLYDEFDVKDINLLQNNIDKSCELFTLNNEKATLEMKKNELIKEYSKFKLEKDISYNAICKISLNKITKKIKSLSKKKDIYKTITNFTMMYHKFYTKSELISEISNFYELLIFYKVLYYKKKIEILSEEIMYLLKKIELYNNENYEEELYKDSKTLFDSYLKKRYNLEKKVNRVKFDEINKSIIKEYPIILSTTHSISGVFKNFKYDYVVIDEASQVDSINAILAMSIAKNIIFVGDLKQLDSIVTNEDKIKEIGKNYNIESNYKLEKNNALKSVIDTLPDVKRTMLREHYRCHSRIIDYCNKAYYNDQLIIYSKNETENPFNVILTPVGNHARDNANQRELDIIKEQIANEKLNDVGIITPYNAQKKLINESNLEAEVDTIHQFQGREKETIIFTTVDNKITDFTNNTSLVNVAVSRAINKFILVTNHSSQNYESNIKKIIDYANYNNFEVTNSNIHSIFDMLYKDCLDKRNEYLKNNKLKTKFDSEKIFDVLLSDILNQVEFSHFDYCFQYPLIDIVKNKEILNYNLLKYASNKNTKIDFLIYNKLDKKPVLALEVNGYNFHKKNSVQYYRDLKKEEVLQLSNIPLLSFFTNESNEKQILVDKLNELI